MVSSSLEDELAYFGFSDLNGFKDYVVYVLSCAPDSFPAEDWLKPEEQMNLDRAFVGLRKGLKHVAQEVSNSELLAQCQELIDQAYQEYGSGHDHAGQLKLEAVEKLLKKVQSR